MKSWLEILIYGAMEEPDPVFTAVAGGKCIQRSAIEVCFPHFRDREEEQ